jgi:hypothetical protein
LTEKLSTVARCCLIAEKCFVQTMDYTPIVSNARLLKYISGVQILVIKS